MRTVLDERDKRPDEIIGIHAQQAVEKTTKAILVSANITPPRTDNLMFLHQLVTSSIDRNQIEADVIVAESN